MDVHSFHQFKPGLKDDVTHYLHLFYITALHWLVILGRFLEKGLQILRLRNLVALVKINIWTPLLGFKRQFSFEQYFDPIKTKATHALDNVSRLSLDRLPTYQSWWLGLVSFRNSAWEVTKTLIVVFRSSFHHYIRTGLAWVRSYLSWLGSFKDTTPQVIRSIAHSLPDVELLGVNAIGNISSSGRHIKGLYSTNHLNGMVSSELLCVGAYLKDYAKDHWEAATDTGSSIFVMMTDFACFCMNGWGCLKTSLAHDMLDHWEAASGTGSSMLKVTASAASFSTKGLAFLKDDSTDNLWGNCKVAINSIFGVTVDIAYSSADGLSGLAKAIPGHLAWIKSTADVSYRCFEPILRIMKTCAAPAVVLFRGVLDALAAFVDFSENLFQTLVECCQGWILRCLDILIDRKLECGLCMMVGILAFKIFTVSREPKQASGPLRMTRKVFAALGYFLKAPVDTLIITVLAAMYILLAFKGLIRFSLLDKLRLEVIVRLNTLPGAWVTDLDEEVREGLFKSTLQLQRPPTQTTFSSLPTNIRSRIYQLALTDQNGFKWDNRMKTLRSNLSPSLLRVSHDTRRSTLAIPFSMNKVLIDSSPKELHPPPSIPKELQRHLLPQPQPCGREQLLDLLTSLRIPRGPTTESPRASNTDSSTPANPPLPHLGTLLATSRTPWVVEIREPYTRVWAFDVHTVISHLPLAPSLVVNYTITIPPGAPRPLSKAQHLARQLGIAAHQGAKDPRFRVYVEGLENWERVVMKGVLVGVTGGVEGDEGSDGGEGEVGAFLCEGKTDLMKEVAKVEHALEEMNRV